MKAEKFKVFNVDLGSMSLIVFDLRQIMIYFDLIQSQCELKITR